VQVFTGSECRGRSYCDWPECTRWRFGSCRGKRSTKVRPPPFSTCLNYIYTIHRKYLILICASPYKLHGLTFISRPKAPSSVEIEQDPTRVATSIAGKQIGIPECAMSVSRAFRTNRVSRSNSVKSSKRRKHTGSNTSLSGVDSAMSDDEDIEDINFLFSEDESPPSKSKRKAPNGLLTL
jgi:hypothetical protein